jgi:hypothetical protein
MAIPVGAQETRGTISGTVRDKDGVLPGAAVKITNTGTNVSQQLVTNASGYFEAPLLIAGDYEVSVEIPNFKSFRQTAFSSRLASPFRSSPTSGGSPARQPRHHGSSSS